MKRVIATALLGLGTFFLPTTAGAQVSPTVPSPGTGEWATTSVGYIPFGTAVTPTTSRQRLERLIAFRDEVAQQKAADGGVLSDDSRADLARKAQRLFAR